MQPRRLLVLALLVSALGAFIWFFERELPSSEERQEMARKVVRLKPEEVEAVTLEWEGERVVLERRELHGQAPPTTEPTTNQDAEPASQDDEDVLAPPDREWRLTHPLEARADENLVRALLTSLAGLEKERTLEDPEPEKLGLDSPRALLSFRRDGKEETLEIGAKIPASSNTLVRLRGEGGGEVHVVRDSLYSDVTRAAGDWRDRKVFTGRRHEIDRIELSQGDETVRLVRRGEDYWLESPIEDRADEDHVNGFLNELTGMLANEFIDDGAGRLGELGLDAPGAVVEVSFEGREGPFRLELGSQVPDDPERSYARSESQVFATDADLQETLTRPAADWRSRAWTALPVYQITSARIQGEGPALELTRDGGDWRRGEDKIGYTTVSDFLYSVDDARAQEFWAPDDPAAASLGPGPVLTFTYKTDEGEETLTLYSRTDSGTPARVDNRDVTLLLDEETVAGIREKLQAVRDAEPLAAEETEDGEGSEETGVGEGFPQENDSEVE